MSSLLEQFEEFAKNHFQTAAKDPNQWLSAAKTHRAGAEKLYLIINELCPDFLDCKDLAEDDPDNYLAIHGITIQYELACGYAVENALKGLAIALKTVTVHKKDGAELTRDILTHNLTRLAEEKCRLSLSDSERRLLSTLQDDIEWAKYPFPKNYKDAIRKKHSVKTLNLSEDISPRAVRIFQSTDQDVTTQVWEFYDRIVLSYPDGIR